MAVRPIQFGLKVGSRRTTKIEKNLVVLTILSVAHSDVLLENGKAENY